MFARAKLRALLLASAKKKTMHEASPGQFLWLVIHRILQHIFLARKIRINWDFYWWKTFTNRKTLDFRRFSRDIPLYSICIRKSRCSVFQSEKFFLQWNSEQFFTHIRFPIFHIFSKDIIPICSNVLLTIISNYLRSITWKYMCVWDCPSTTSYRKYRILFQFPWIMKKTCFFLYRKVLKCSHCTNEMGGYFF